MPQVQASAAAEGLERRLVWLDFLDDLLNATSASLKPALQFDGTHLAPTYTEHLNLALQCIQ